MKTVCWRHIIIQYTITTQHESSPGLPDLQTYVSCTWNSIPKWSCWQYAQGGRSAAISNFQRAVTASAQAGNAWDMAFNSDGRISTTGDAKIAISKLQQTLSISYPNSRSSMDFIFSTSLLRTWSIQFGLSHGRSWSLKEIIHIRLLVVSHHGLIFPAVARIF
jgi:hypothetical protein